MDNYESEVKMYCGMVDNVFDGFLMPISISPNPDIDSNKLILKILQKQENKLIVNVDTYGLINNHELITPEMFLKTFYNSILDACENDYRIHMNRSQFGDDLKYGEIYNLIEKLPQIIIGSNNEIDGIIIIFREYYRLKSKMPNNDFLFFLFKNKLLPNHNHVCYIFSGEYLLFNKQTFKAEFKYFEKEDRLLIKVKRDYDFLKTIHIGYQISVDLDEYRIPVALEIIGVSKKLDLGRGLYYLSIDIELENNLMEITLELNNNNLIIVYKNNEFFPNGLCKFDLK